MLVTLSLSTEKLMPKNQLPLVSIVIPNFNRGYCIEKTVQSVIDQTYQNWELLVIDNNSTDDSVELINKFGDNRISITTIDNNGIIAKSRNLGIKISKGKYVAFLDSDDWWSKIKLERSILELESGYDLIYHDLYLVTSNKRLQFFFRRLKTRSLKAPIFLDLLYNGNAINNSSVVASRSILNDIEGFSEEDALVGSEDFEGWLRFSAKSNKFSRIDLTLGYYWFGSGNMTSPTRSLSNLKNLKENYKSKLLEKFNNGLAPWMIYSLSRSYLGVSDYKNASKFAKIGIFSELGIWLKFKLFITFIQSKFHFLH